MRFIDDETGQRHNLFETAELEAEFKAHGLKFDCSHGFLELRRRTVAGGAIQIKNQCLECGRAIGNPVKRNEQHDNIAVFDESKELAVEKARKSDYLTICRKHLKIQTDRRASHQIEYSEYLASPVWVEKRQRVLKRANNICEGCLEQAAQHIHHLTYNNIFNEFMFELVALCKSCHDRLHGKLNSDAEDRAIEDFEPPCCACRWQDWRGNSDWCGKFDVSVSLAMAENGPCGPRQTELEGLK